MKKLLLIGLSAALLGCATGRTGPTLGEFLDKGAKKLTQAQYTSVMSGRVVNGQTTSGLATANLTFNANGTVQGTVTAKSGSVSKSVGTWSVDENGKYCLDENLVDWNMKHKECNYMFVLGNDAILVDSDTDRNARTTVRPIK